MAGTVIKRVGILGSGIMGAGLAEVAAKAGCEVIVRSRHRTTADALLAGLGRSLDRQVEKGKLDDRTRGEILGRVVATDHLRALVECDLVIESVVEDLAVKKALFAELEQVVQPDAILATNTSTFPVVELAVQTERPDRGLRRPLLQPRAAHAPRRDRAPAHGQRRDRRRRCGPSP